jgi:hypothetical protein
MKDYATKDDGRRTTSSTGALRSDSTGKGRFDLISPIALTRLAQVYERGGLQKGDRNWEKGFPVSRALSSAIRHIFQYLAGMRDEDHLAQACWNIFAAIHFEEMVERGNLPKELLDIPNEKN